MSYVKFMRTFRCFLGLFGVPKTEAQGVKYNNIRRFLPTLGEVLRVDTTEAQSLSNWIEIADGRDRREARARHPTSRHYAGDKLTFSGLGVEALCQAVPCGIRDCKESLISLTWSDVRVALPDLDQAWQQALRGLKELRKHTNDPFLKGKVVTEAVPANREKSNDHHVTDPFCLFDTIDAAEVVVPCADLATPLHLNHRQMSSSSHRRKKFRVSTPSCRQVNMFRKTVIAVTARRHTSYWLRLQILPSSHIASQISSRTNVLRCWTPTSLAQRAVNDASKDGKVKTVLQRSPL